MRRDRGNSISILTLIDLTVAGGDDTQIPYGKS
jgi:hypothetical protein